MRTRRVNSSFDLYPPASTKQNLHTTNRGMWSQTAYPAPTGTRVNYSRLSSYLSLASAIEQSQLQPRREATEILESHGSSHLVVNRLSCSKPASKIVDEGSAYNSDATVKGPCRFLLLHDKDDSKFKHGLAENLLASASRQKTQRLSLMLGSPSNLHRVQQPPSWPTNGANRQ